VPSPLDQTETLLQRLAAGERDVLGELFDHYRQRLRREIAADLAADPRLLARFDASDVVQDVFLDSCRQLDYFLAHRDRLDFLAWLRGLARERRLKYQRNHLDAQCRSLTRQQPIPDSSGGHPAAPGSGPEGAVARAEEADRAREALSQLSPDDQEIIRLRLTEGKANQEVAAVLGTTPAAAAKRLERALARLKMLLDGGAAP
jgi:RNA polymerase sigma-70 factor (ECF subfamily)